jgi:hypothetical protein
MTLNVAIVSRSLPIYLTLNPDLELGPGQEEPTPYELRFIKWNRHVVTMRFRVSATAQYRRYPFLKRNDCFERGSSRDESCRGGRDRPERREQSRNGFVRPCSPSSLFTSSSAARAIGGPRRP